MKLTVPRLNIQVHFDLVSFQLLFLYDQHEYIQVVHSKLYAFSINRGKFWKIKPVSSSP